MNTPSVADDPRGWEEACLRGNAGTLGVIDAQARARGMLDWQRCVQVRRAMFAPAVSGDAREASMPEVDRGAATQARVLASALATRASILALDVAGASAWSTTPALAQSTTLLADATRLWAEALCGNDPEAVLRRARELETLARARKQGLVVVDAATLDALATLESGDVKDGLARARRASRMAAAEGIGPMTVLAHVVLARARRAHGQPHLGAHIAATVALHVSASCRAWATWERMLGAGAAAAPPEDVTAPLHALLHGAQRGDRIAYQGALAEADRAPLPAFARRDLAALQELLDVEAYPLATAAWASGEVDAIPLGLDASGTGVQARAYVLARPGVDGRRVLASGVALARADTGASVVPGAVDQARTDSAVAALLLAGAAGVDTGAFFLRLYGFPLHERHRGVLRVLLHRVRARVSGWAELEHEGGRATLVPSRPVLFPDPRCEPADADVLSVAAHHGRLVARELAEALGLPLRRAQDALKRLAEAGVFRAIPDGRIVHYVLEDTTFTQLTPPA